MKIIIAGASSGIGHYLANSLVEEGHEVWGLSRRLLGNPGKYRASQCDVTNWDSLKEIAHEVETEWKSADALISCTGIQGAVGPTMSLNPKDWCETVHQNIDGVFYTLHTFYPLLMKSQGRSKVICFSGGGATAPRVNFTAYGIAKAALVRLTETLAEEWKDAPIDINAIAPGAIRTRLTEEVIQLGPEVVGSKEYEQALKVMETGGGSLEKVQELVQFLLSADSDGVSGKLIAAQWDPWKKIPELALDSKSDFNSSETYTLRRVVPKEWS